VGFGISGIEPSDSAARDLVCLLDLKEIGGENESWIELAENRVWCLALELAVLNLRVLQQHAFMLRSYIP